MGEYDPDGFGWFPVDSQSPSSPVISSVAIIPVNVGYHIALCVDDEYQDCTIKLDTGAGLSENTHISYSSYNKALEGEISNQMYTHLKEAAINGVAVTLTITVVS